MASAQDTIAEREPGLSWAAADPALLPVSNVPWAPTEIVYLHQDAAVADDDEPADFNHVHGRAPSRLRRAIPLLWAVVLTIAALQHAGEIERRTALREPPVAELQMLARTEREIKAAWRSVGAIAEVKPVEPVAQAVESKPLTAERQHPEPAKETANGTPKVDDIQPAVTTHVTPPADEETDHSAETTGATGPQSMTDAGQAIQPLVEEPAAAKPDRKEQIITSHPPRHQITRSPEPARTRPARAETTKYVVFDGHSPRYFTLERPGRASP